MDVALTLRVARGEQAQQAEIDAWLRKVDHARSGAVVAEGAFFDLNVPDGVALARLAPGCVCCVGLVPMRVTLTRLLRQRRPNALLLLISDASHLDRVRALVEGGKLGLKLAESG